MDEVLSTLPTADILVIDDQSPDGTGQWCVERSKSEPRLHCLLRPGKLGLGTAHVAAMQYAVEHRYGGLITMDADYSHPPRYLPQLVAGLQHADVVIGSR